MSAQPGIRTPDLLHVKPVCYHYATATSCNIELKVGSLNHLKYSLVSNFLSEINKAISYFIYLLNTLATTFASLISLCQQKKNFSTAYRLKPNPRQQHWVTNQTPHIVMGHFLQQMVKTFSYPPILPFPGQEMLKKCSL